MIQIRFGLEVYVSVDFEKLDQFATSHLSERIKNMGVGGSGAHKHYAQLVAKGSILQQRPIGLAQILIDKFPDQNVFHELGDGVGLCMMALFALGGNTLVISQEARRAGLAVSLAEAIKHDFLKTNRQFRVLREKFPTLLTDLLQTQEPEAILVSLDTVGSVNANIESSIIDRISRYRQSVIDIRRLTKVRSSETEQAELIARFTQKGLRVHEELQVDADSRFIWFQQI